MRNIRYEEYVTHVEKRLDKYTRLSMYRWKASFMKNEYPLINADMFYLFKRYMNNDIYIKWDIENEED